MKLEEKLLWDIFGSSKESEKMIKTIKFVRKPFPVEAVYVTEENMDAVAEWCHGNIEGSSDGPTYIKVRVHRPMTKKQTEAHIGDVVSYTETGFKVYTKKAFEKSFEPAHPTITNNPMADIPNDPFLNMEAVAEGDDIAVLDNITISGKFEANVNEGVLDPDAVLREQVVVGPGFSAVVTTEVSNNEEASCEILEEGTLIHASVVSGESTTADKDASEHNHSGPVCSSRCPANRKYVGPTVEGQKLPVENLYFND